MIHGNNNAFRSVSLAMPLVVAAVHRTKDSAVLARLDALCSQITRHKLDHNGEPPIFYQGTLLQLLQATNADGMPGSPGKDRPNGPYFHQGFPANPVTGRSTVTRTTFFPPTKASAKGGWLFHQDTGQIALDLAEMLDWQILLLTLHRTATARRLFASAGFGGQVVSEVEIKYQ